jgi:glycosyltransferase involved in cell wall biosynthesis
MKTFFPYQIHHIYLDNTLDSPVFDANEKGNYLVFWWKDIGLGQFFIEPNKPLNEKEYNEQLINAIKPAIDFYAKKENIINNGWEHWLLNKMFEAWNSWMETLLSKFTAVKIPVSVPVSVIICTRNRAAYLQQCLTMLKALDCIPEEIVVVDNAPADDTSKIVVENFEGVKYVKEPRGGLDIARNTGILNTTLPIIAFVDDDVSVHPLWAYNTWETFQNPSVAAMTGLVIAAELETEAQLIFEKHWSFNRGYSDKVYGTDFFKSTMANGPPVWEIGAGANMAFRKSVFEKTGYFDEILDAGAAGCSGDSEMWFRILAKEYTIHYNPRAVVFHEHRKDLKGLKKQIFYYMRGFTTAALIQQKQYPETGYKYRLRTLLRYYWHLTKKEFPYYRFQFKTLWDEISGILSGLLFYRKHKNRLPNP